jgi:hypothetical protein|tara:strand:- start:252 stop:620 length:369 start_codon:yes stop_codon:yes gene_type:complete
MDGIERSTLSKFNMSQRILLRIDAMQTLAAQYYREGELVRWFFEWKNIKFQIIGKLDEDEQDKLIGLEKDITKYVFDGREGQVLTRKEKSIPLIEKYVGMLQLYIEEKEIGLVSKGDETIFT